jgi:hypothetical protein
MGSISVVRLGISMDSRYMNPFEICGTHADIFKGIRLFNACTDGTCDVFEVSCTTL